MNLLDNLLPQNFLLANQSLFAEKAVFEQQKVLRKLLKKAARTAFGKAHGFDEIRRNRAATVADFRQAVPVSDYKMMRNWWDDALAGRPDVAWPGLIPFWATSSGTSEGRQKFIPVSHELMKSVYRGGTRQFMAMGRCGLPASHFSKKILCVSSSSELRWNGSSSEGYISGITAQGMPKWFEFYHKPGRRINALDWEEKVDKIVENAPRWDVGSLVGLPNWTQIILERVVETYQLDHIHDLWPNLRVFQHSGMAFGPYRASFERLLGRPLVLFETYFASEGFFGWSDRPRNSGTNGLRLVTDGGIFFEFIPFDDHHFEADGSLKNGHNALTITELKANVPYAMVISTNAGAWRYLLGDVVQFTNPARLELEIVGRTTTFLNLCGEHLTEANLNAAVGWLNDHFDLGIREFCIVPGRSGRLFSHHWFVGTNCEVCPDFIREKLDARLRELNEYYDFERTVSLKEVKVTCVPPHFFKKWLEKKAASQPQQKFPRVLSGRNLELWKELLQTENRFQLVENY